ncbi:MAG: beta-glucosidase [Streptosporangiales bacterium]|nr:beta-glucosidase [Streptosporangiales bacterium]
MARRVRGRWAVMAAGSAVVMGVSWVGPAQAEAASAAAKPDKIDRLIAAMTLDEKIALLHGGTDPASVGQAGYVPGVPRLGIPELRLTDGPAGVRVTKPSTALPAPVSLGSTFSTELATQYGGILGRETRAQGADVLLGPMTNIIRVPQAGRNFETLSEDPFVTATIGAAEVRGVQRAGAIATVKHYAENNQEEQRGTIDVRVDEQTMQEIELPGFGAAVEAGAGAVMCAYNKVNGDYAGENSTLLTDILKEQFGFAGWVMSDWGATHSTEKAITAGLDMQMPNGSYFGAPLKTAVESGRLDVAVVDRSVRRILVSMDRAGLLDGATPRPEIDERAGARVSRDVAEQGAVLLRNQRGALPLGRDDLRSLGLIGPTAKTTLVGGGGSARVTPLHTTSTLDELRRHANVRYAAGVDLDGAAIPASALSLTRTNTSTGETRPDPQVDYTGPDALPAGSAWRWTGTFTAPRTGDYELKLQTAGGSGTLSVDGTQVLTTGGFFSDASLIPTADDLTNASYPVHLTAGEAHEITLTGTAEAETPLQIRFGWLTPTARESAISTAVATAKKARAAVVFGYDEGTESRDRTSLGLPGYQNELIDRVAAANPDTVVVLNTGSSVLMPWKDKVRAILETWYPGEEGGTATARLLLGHANPSGKLTQTFPADPDQTPTSTPERYPGVDGLEQYSEGIYVGYRWYDAEGVEPLYAFGHGLSYTTFGYSGLRVRPAADGGLNVAFTVRNTGSRTGTEVPQVYIGRPDRVPAGVQIADRSLAGFERVTLKPGQARSVRIHVAKRQLSYWSAADDAWTVATGRRPVDVGSSSRDLRLHGETAVR